MVKMTQCIVCGKKGISTKYDKCSSCRRLEASQQKLSKDTTSVSNDDLNVEPVFVEKKENQFKEEIKKEETLITPEVISIPPATFKPIYLLSNKYFQKYGVETMDNSEINAVCTCWANLFNQVIPDLAKKHPVILSITILGFVHISYGLRVGQVVIKKKKLKKEGKLKELSEEEQMSDINEAVRKTQKEIRKGFPALDIATKGDGNA